MTTIIGPENYQDHPHGLNSISQIFSQKKRPEHPAQTSSNFLNSILEDQNTTLQSPSTITSIKELSNAFI